MTKKKHLQFSAPVKKLKKANAYLNEIRTFRKASKKADCYFALKVLIALLSAGLYGYTTYDTALGAVSKVYNLSRESMNAIALAIYADSGGMIFSAKNSTQLWPTISASLTNTFRGVKTGGLTPEALLEKGRKLVLHDRSLTSKIFAIALPFVIAALSAGCALQSENGADRSMVILFALTGMNTNTLGTAKLPQTLSEALSIFDKNQALSKLEKLTEAKLHSLPDEEVENLLNTFRLLTKNDVPDEEIEIVPKEEDKDILRRVIAAELGMLLDERDQLQVETRDGNIICLDDEGRPIKINSQGEVLTELASDQEIIEFAGVLQQFENVTEVFQKINLMIQKLKMTPDELIRVFEPESKGWRGFKAGLTVFSTLVGATSVTSNAFTIGLLQEITGKWCASVIGEAAGGVVGNILGAVLAASSAGVSFLVHIPAFILSTKVVCDFILHPLNSLKSLIKSPSNLVALAVGGAVAYGAWMMHFFTTAENNPIKNPEGANIINLTSAASFALNTGLATFYLTKTVSGWLWSGVKNCCQIPKSIREEAAEICKEVLDDAMVVKQGLSSSSMTAILKGLPSASLVMTATEAAPLLEEDRSSYGALSIATVAIKNLEAQDGYCSFDLR